MGGTLIRWTWALPLVAVIWWLAVVNERPAIEADLKHRSDAALKSAGLTWAATRFDAIEGYVAGTAYKDEERARAREVVEKVWGVWTIADRTKLVAHREKYRWAAELEGDVLSLSGFYPNAAVRKAVRDASTAAIPSAQLRDTMEPARGAPDEAVWLAGVQFALSQLGGLKSGRVALETNALTIDGEARDSAAYARIKRSLSRSLPTGIVLAADGVKPPLVVPFEWSASFDANAVSLGGYVPNDAAREMLMATVKSAFPNRAIVDKMSTAGGAPRGWIDTVKGLIGELANLQSGAIEIKGDAFDVSGVAVKQKTAEDVQERLDSLGVDFRVTHAIRYLEPTIPTVSPFLTSLLKTEKGILLSGYAPSQAEIDRLIAAAKRRANGSEVISTVTIANGAPEGWRLCTAAGLEGLSRLDTGRAEIIGRKLNVSGTTADEEVGLSLPDIVRAAANRACDDVVEVKIDIPPEPNLTWSAVASGAEIALSGEVPTSEVKAALFSQAQALFPKHAVIDKMRVQPSRSQKWPKVASSLLELLAVLREGEARIEGQSIALIGQARDTAVATAVQTRMKRGLMKGYTGDARIEVKSDAMIWAKQETQRQAEAARTAEAQRRLAEAARRKAEEEAARLRAEEERKQKLEEEQRLAEQRRLAADADLLRRAREYRERVEAERAAMKERERAEAEARRQAEAERRRAVDADLLRRAREYRERVEAERAAARERERAEAEARRLAEQRRRAADADLLRRAREYRERVEAERAAVKERERAEAEARRLAEAERRRAADADLLRRAREYRERVEAERAAAKERERGEVEARHRAEEAARRHADAERVATQEQRRRAELQAEAEEHQRRVAEQEAQRRGAAERARKVAVARKCDAGFRRAIERNRIRFRFNSADIRPPSRRTLNRIADLIRSCEGMRVEISGHTDTLGSAGVNLELSERRAGAVREYLIGQGVDPERLVAKGYGETRPLVANVGARNRALNRRIEFRTIVE
jgi:OmpA-OmpF porin, OOP family